MGTGDIAFFAALVAVDEAVGVVWAGVGHGDGGGGKGLFELGLEGDGDGEGRAGFLVAVVRVVELALQRRRVGHRAHTRHRPSSPPPLVDLASTVTCHKPREPPRKVSWRSTTILPLQQMAHADHTRDPWCVSRGLRYVVSPFFSQPLGHPQRLWRRLFHGRRGRWHLVWHQGRQKLSPSLSFCLSFCPSLTSPQGERLIGAVSSIKARAPVTGGNFGVWGGMFSTFDCAIKGWRQKEDAWNAILSGFMTGGCLAARSPSFVILYSSSH